MLTENQFNILSYFVKNTSPITQRGLQAVFDCSLGKINRLIQELQEMGLLSAEKAGGYTLTSSGLKALEPYKVNNAVIMAAGMSSRFAPLSYEKPKGLLKVKGEILIEREIRQLQEAGITDITLVVGYMKEKFFYLQDKFNVKIVVNEDYYRYNNTSTLIQVTDKLSNTYICSSDNYFVDNVFEPYVYRAYYSAVYAAGETDEYCLTCETNGRIKKVTIGGENSWYMLGHVYFDREFSDKFVSILKKEYTNQETKEHLWENLYMRYIKELSLFIRKYEADKVLEFDSLDELRAFDSEYINNADSSILKNICTVLKCEIKDIVNIKAIKAGLTNTSFQFSLNGKSYVYRHPGVGTEKYINREGEGFSMKIASELGLDKTFVYMDSKEGWKISRFVENARELDYHKPAEVSESLRMMRTLHDSGKVSPFDFDVWVKTEEFLDRLEGTGKKDTEDFVPLLETMKKVHGLVTTDPYAKKCLCHCDCYSPNFLLDDSDRMYLIDWEYSGNDDPASDLGTFICCSDYDFDQAVAVITEYLGRKPEGKELGHYFGYVAEASYYWYVWALYQETRGNFMGNWLYMWYSNSKLYSKKAIEQYS